MRDDELPSAERRLDMPKVEITLEEETYNKLVGLSKKTGLSVGSLLETLLESSLVNMDELADEIISHTTRVCGQGNPTKPVHYPGGDWWIKDEIIDLLIKSECKTLVEVFGGSGVISMYAPRSIFKFIIYNDKDSLLTNFFTVLKERPKELMRGLALLPVSRELYYSFVKLIESGEIRRLTPLERAVIFFYVNRVSVDGKPKGGFAVHTGADGTTTATRFRHHMLSLIEYAKRWADVTIENRDFRDVIKLYDRDFVVFYCDPPFLSIEADRGGYYSVPFTPGDMQALLKALSNIKGKFVLKLHEDQLKVPFISDWVRRYNVKVVEHFKIMDTVVEEKRPKQRTLLVYNYPSLHSRAPHSSMGGLERWLTGENKSNKLCALREED
jgi:DNA adenine methylase